MTTSSQPKNSLNDLIIGNIDDILKDCTIDLSGTGASMNDITITSPSNYSMYNYNNTSSTITLSGISQPVYTINTADTITLTSGDDQFDFNFGNVEWEDSFPEWNRIQEMCKKYPGLKIAYDNFRVFYEMVKDDYDNPTPKK